VPKKAAYTPIVWPYPDQKFNILTNDDERFHKTGARPNNWNTPRFLCAFCGVFILLFLRVVVHMNTGGSQARGLLFLEHLLPSLERSLEATLRQSSRIAHFDFLLSTPRTLVWERAHLTIGRGERQR